MAIEKIPFPASVPAAVSDYQKQNALLAALVKSVDGAQKIVGGNIVQGAVFNVGGTLYVATSDTAITGVASDYVKLTPSGDTLTLAPSYVASLSGVTWNAEYKGYYDGSGNLYEFDEAKALNDSAISETFIRNKDIFTRDVIVGRKVDVIGHAPGEYVIPGCIVIDSKTTSSTEYSKLIEIKAPYTGQVRVLFRLGTPGASTTVYGRIYVNNIARGIERIIASAMYTDYNEDIDVSYGDLIQIYAKTTNPGVGQGAYITYCGLKYNGPGVMSEV